jgi:arsenate reductase
MAEALLRLLADDQFDAYSAGTHPVGLNPLTVEVMGELGVDIRQYRSKNVTEFLGESFDDVITVCDRAKETCPVFHGARNLLHWSFDDPAAAHPEARPEAFRLVRDHIAKQIQDWLRTIKQSSEL